jgi:hypothetical protein
VRQTGRTGQWLAAAALAGQCALAGAAAAQAPAAATPPAAAPADAEVEAVRQRVAEFYAARLAGDARAQWALLEPRVRARMTAEEFAMRGAQTRYLGYKVEEAVIRGAFAAVRVRLLTLTPLPTAGRGVRHVPPQVSMGQENWIRLGGQWYRMIEEVEPPPARAPTSG